MGESKRDPLSRRELLKSAGAAAGLGLLGIGAEASERGQPPLPQPAGQTVMGMRFAPRAVVRVGLIGCGGRGMSLLRDLLGIDGVRVSGVCDLVPEKVAKAQALVEKAARQRPEGYSRGDHDYENLCRREDLDLVYVATPWRWHVPMAVSAMESGHHVGVEVPAATTLADCWTLVDTSERSRRHCVILENCCYGWNEMLVLNMVRAGLLGEVHHGEAAYIHDLRGVLFDQGEGLWRRDEHFTRNGNLYPTHGLGPVARYMEVHRGDRFEVLVSMSSPERGLSLRRDRLPAGDPRRSERYACGDMNTSLIRTARGRTVVLQHDVVSPRPYDRINLVSGTQGCFRDYPPRLYLDGQEEDKWQSLKRWKERFEDPLWKRLGKAARKSGHGGMDYIMSWRLIQCLREGLAPDLDVYDAAAWSAPAPLSEASVAHGSAPQAFPDFTRGRWAEKRA